MSAATARVVEARIAGRRFVGLDPAVMLEIITGSSGVSGATENQWPTRAPDKYDLGVLLSAHGKTSSSLSSSSTRPLPAAAVGSKCHREASLADLPLDPSPSQLSISRFLPATVRGHAPGTPFIAGKLFHSHQLCFVPYRKKVSNHHERLQDQKRQGDGSWSGHKRALEHLRGRLRKRFWPQRPPVGAARGQTWHPKRASFISAEEVAPSARAGPGTCACSCLCNAPAGAGLASLSEMLAARVSR